MTSYVNELHDRMKRAAEVQKFNGRIKKLKKKKQPDSNRKWTFAAFCGKHGLDDSQISHAMAGRRGLTWETIDAIKKAFTAEGV